MHPRQLVPLAPVVRSLRALWASGMTVDALSRLRFPSAAGLATGISLQMGPGKAFIYPALESLRSHFTAMSCYGRFFNPKALSVPLLPGTLSASVPQGHLKKTRPTLILNHHLWSGLCLPVLMQGCEKRLPSAVPIPGVVPALLPAGCDSRLKSSRSSKAPSKGERIRKTTYPKNPSGVQEGCCFMARARHEHGAWVLPPPLPAACLASGSWADFASRVRCPPASCSQGRRHNAHLSQTFLSCLLEPVIIIPSQGSKLGNPGQDDSRVPTRAGGTQASWQDKCPSKASGRWWG